MTRRNCFFNSQYLIAALVVVLSAALGALLMGALAGGWATADAANTTPAATKNAASAEADATRRIKVDNFSGICSYQAIEVELTQGRYPGYVEVTGSEEALDHLVAEVKTEGTLILRYLEFRGSAGRKTVVRITADGIRALQALSASRITVRGTFSFNGTLTAEALSAGAISFGEVNGENLDLKATSAGDIYALVTDVDHIDATATSAARISLRGINARNVKAVATSAGNIVLSGRCNSSSVSTASKGDVATRGLILEKSLQGNSRESTAATLRRP